MRVNHRQRPFGPAPARERREHQPVRDGQTRAPRRAGLLIASVPVCGPLDHRLMESGVGPSLDNQ